MELTHNEIEFLGPYAFRGVPSIPSIFEEARAQGPGVYLMTVERNDRYHILYVGMAVDIATRMETHLSEYLAGKYWIYDIEKLKEIKRVDVHKPHGGAVALLRDYEKIEPHLVEMVNLLRLFFVPLEADRNTLLRLESGIIGELRVNPDTRSFLENRGVSKKITEDQKYKVIVNSKINLVGLPQQLFV